MLRVVDAGAISATAAAIDALPLLLSNGCNAARQVTPLSC